MLAFWFVLNISQSRFTELLHDEAYYYIYSQDLAWGYYDHPPVIALMIRLGMLLFDKPSCMPSLLGILLLFGIIIKNAVLLIDFYQEYRKKESAFESAKEAVKVRFRPVMMTAFGTIAGMIPIALEQAVGLERLSPLADVAIGGLLVGTFLTLIYIPMYAYIFDRTKNKG